MKAIGLLFVSACAALLCGCSSTVPSALTSARNSYQQASAGPAARWSPAELHKAKVALTEAEDAYADDADEYRVQDLAYVAQRKAEMAEVYASIAMEQKDKASLVSELQQDQSEIMKEQAADLSQAKVDLAASEQSGQAKSAQIAAEQTARRDAVTAATDQAHLLQSQSTELVAAKEALTVSEEAGRAQAAELADLLASREEARGTIYTLPGGLLFRSNEAVLMPGAETRLHELVAVLSAAPDRNVVIEGHTDSQGSDSQNLDLACRRADAVRSYLVRQGCAENRVVARGIGEAVPVADNATSEGRANNRRVEIVLVAEAQR